VNAADADVGGIKKEKKRVPKKKKNKQYIDGKKKKSLKQKIKRC